MSAQGRCKCDFPSARAHAEALARFTKALGDDISDETIREAAGEAKLADWKSFCVCADPRRITSAAHFEDSDWYMCTVKHVATDRALCGQGQ